jgi:hypothetical protein
LLPKDAEYEPQNLPYVVTHQYRPDFRIRENTYIEAKGRFLSADRAKHLYIKEQHPEVKIYFLFGNAENKLTKSSKTSYADWCNKHGFEYADFYREGIPKKWFK